MYQITITNHQNYITMKKTFLLIVAMLMMGSAAFAGGGFGVAIGAKAGYQTARLSYKEADIKDGFANHFNFGVFGRINIGRFYVQPELIYFKTSNIFDATVTGVGTSNLFNLPTGAHANVTLNSMNLQVPVLIGFNIIDFKLLAIRAQVGPTASFVVGSTTIFDNTYTLDGQQYDLDVENPNGNQNFDPKTIAWGLQAGIGIDVIDLITLDINYNFGLSKVFNALNDTALGNTFDFSNVDTSKQNMFMVTLGIKLIKL